MRQALFHTFKSQEERRSFGGSYFVEFAYDDSSHIEHWRNDSLYVHGDDQSVFYNQYSAIFCNGEYPNGKKGVVYMWGPNYYSPEETKLIIKRLQKRNSDDDQILLKWLERVGPNDGFWILGI